MLKKKGNILLIEDDNHTREGLLTLLSYEGYRVHMAEDGFQAQEQLVKYLFDLTLLDIEIPGLDGIETMHTIHEIQPLSKIIVVTANLLPVIIQEGNLCGISSYLEKPIRYEILKRIIQNIS